MRTVSAIFESRGEADVAVEALADAGIKRADISVVSPEKASSHAAEGAGIGAAVGGVIAGIGAFAIPGIGPVIGSGWLVASLVGAAAGGAAGGVIGSMTKAGIQERDAHVYAESVKRGCTLVSALVDDDQGDIAQAILRENSAVDPNERMREYEASGWSNFDDSADPWDVDAEETYKRREDRDPVVTPYPR